MENQSNYYPLATTGHSPIASELIKIKNNRTMTTTIEVATMFEKKHKNVLRDVEGLECSKEFWRLNFEPRDYVDGRGKTYPMIEMTRNGFTILAMGYTGKKAMQFKETYIAAFDYMESLLHQQSIQAANFAERIDARLDKIEQALKSVRNEPSMASPVGMFVRDRCDIIPLAITSKKDLYANYMLHSLRRGVLNYMPRNSFFKSIYMTVAGTRSGRFTDGAERVPCVVGLRLNKETPRNQELDWEARHDIQ